MPTTGSGISSPVVGPIPGAALPSRTQPYTCLSLSRFAEIIHYSPMLFNQVYVQDLQPASSCSDPILQYTWQPNAGGKPGRDEIAWAIRHAEEAMERAISCPPAPKWFADEIAWPVNSWPRHYYGPSTLRTNKSRVIEGGREAWTPIGTSQPVTYSDADGDGYKERATVVVTTTVTDPNEIAVYYPNSAHAQEWEIRPINVRIAGGSATVTFRRDQAVKSSLLEELDSRGVDGLLDENFLEAVDVYRHYTSQAEMASLEWDSEDSIEAHFVVQDSVNGLVGLQAGTYNAVTQTWEESCTPWVKYPGRAKLWYRAGLVSNERARPMHDMSIDMERAIAFLALAYMDREWQTCEQLRNLQDHWRTDLSARTSNPSSSLSFQVSRQLLDNPFGTTRAAVAAWRVAQPLIVGRAVLL